MLTALLLLVLLASCVGPSASTELKGLVDQEWSARLARDPLLAASEGLADGGAGLADPSPAVFARQAEEDRRLAGALEAVDPTGLGAQDRITRSMLLREVRDRVQDFEHGAWRQPLTSDSGFHLGIARIPRGTVIEDEAGARAYLDRLRAIPAYFEAQIQNLRQGLADGVSMPRVILDGYDEGIEQHVVADPTRSTFHSPLASLPGTIDEATQKALVAEGRGVIADSVVPAYQSLLEFWRKEYLPGARTTIGLFEVEGGRAWYEHLVRHFTTLDMNPEEVHEVGLSEVARIREDMEATMAETGFEGTFAEFLEFLRTDTRFYSKSSEELLAYASYLAKRADGALPRFFGRLPREPYGVAPVPDAIAPRYTAGRYVSSSRSTESGTYWVNTFQLASRPLYALPALTLHEAMPGHHLQIALAAELEGLPAFRNHVYVNAFGEGWALYCEYLGREMGMYDDPYDEFGRQTYEMWRAARLVVDTGLHAFGWTREAAVEFLASNTALSMLECRTEVDRYISWPGQALSYKIGELEIRRLRAEAERRLGPTFDLRSFHDEVIGHGPLSLDVLGEVIEAWIQAGG